MFNQLSAEEKIHNLCVRATALFARNEHEYATVTINSWGHPYLDPTAGRTFQVYLVMWDENVRVSCEAIDRHLEEEDSLDVALDKLNEFLLTFEVRVLVDEGKKVFSGLSV